VFLYIKYLFIYEIKLSGLFADLCRVHIVLSVYASVDQKNIENNPYISLLVFLYLYNFIGYASKI